MPDAGRKRREMDRWQSYVRGLEWKSLQPWTPDQPGNFRHLHQLFEGKSVLIAYAAKKTAGGDDYYVAAKLDLTLIAKDWIPDEMDVVTGKRRVVILDEVARAVYGEPQPPTPFQYEAAFGKTLYAWRIQITPRNVAELRAQAETERILGVLLVPVSTVIIALGLGVVWLLGARGAACLADEERLHRQRLARAEDAAVADPDVRRAWRPGNTRARR